MLYGVVDSRVTEQDTFDNVCFGKVKWLDPAPSLDDLTCDLCGSMMSLVCQLSCPFPGSSKNRKIFVLVCTEHAKETAGWRVIRQVAENVPQPSQNQHNADDWGEADEWGDDEEVGWMAQGVENMNVSSEPSPALPKHIELKELNPGLYINVYNDYEEEDMEHENELLRKYELQEQADNQSNSGDSCGMEEDDDEEDSPIEEFLATLRKVPEQILRYAVLGKPVSLDPRQLSSGTLPPCCEHCGASRCFEFQLMPKLVDLTKGRLEFGTIQIFVCSKNCTSKPNNREYLVLQAEPDAERFK